MLYILSGKTMKIKKLFLPIVFATLIFLEISHIYAGENIKGTGTSNVDVNIKKPKIVFDEQTYDFGKVFIGENVQHKYEFKNVGKGELIINNVKSSCGCTAALVSKINLLTNEKGEVEVKFNPGSYVGRVSKSVTVNSNDPENPRFKLTITGEVAEEVTVNPKRINFGMIKKGEKCSKNMEIKPTAGVGIETKKVESPNQYVTITQKSDTDYQVDFTKNDYIGRFNGIIFIYTNSKKQERIDVPFSGEVVGDVTYYPENISFGNIRKGLEVKRTVILNFISKEVKIEKIEVVPSNLNYAMSELNNMSSKRIDIKLGNDVTIGKISGSLKIFTNSTIQPVINIPINGEIKG